MTNLLCLTCYINALLSDKAISLTVLIIDQFKL
jgi:hypothetical protein